MPRPNRIDTDAVVTVAVAIVDERGITDLSLSTVAAELGVRPSALYTHVDGADGLRHAVAVRAIHNLTHTVRSSAIGVSGQLAVRSIADAYRDFVRRHPGQYSATLSPPPRDRDQLDAATSELLGVLQAVFRNAGLSPSAAQRAAESTRSSLHGFLALEVHESDTAGRDAHFEHLVELLLTLCATDD